MNRAFPYRSMPPGRRHMFATGSLDGNLGMASALPMNPVVVRTNSRLLTLFRDDVTGNRLGSRWVLPNRQ